MMQGPVPCSRKGIAAWPARTVAIMSTDIPPAQPSSSSLMPKAEALLTRTDAAERSRGLPDIAEDCIPGREVAGRRMRWASVCGDLGVRPREVFRPARAGRDAGPGPREGQRDRAADAAAAAGDYHPPAVKVEGHILRPPVAKDHPGRRGSSPRRSATNRACRQRADSAGAGPAEALAAGLVVGEHTLRVSKARSAWCATLAACAARVMTARLRINLA